MNSKSRNSVIRKWFLISLGTVGCIVIIYFLLIGFVVSNGYRRYTKFCSEYIPLLEQYHSDNMSYPENLSHLIKPKYSPRYKIEECSYAKTEKGFSFFVPEGLMGAAIYDSRTKKWVYD